MTASLPDRLRKAADELESLRCAEDAALMREAAEALEHEPVYVTVEVPKDRDALAELAAQFRAEYGHRL